MWCFAAMGISSWRVLCSAIQEGSLLEANLFCEHARNQSYRGASESHQGAARAQLNLTLNILANLLLGIFFPACIYQNEYYGKVACIPGEGESEKKLIEWIKKYLNLILCLVKLYPAVVALRTYAKISRIFDMADAGRCSDDGDEMTPDTFSDLKEEMVSSMNSLIIQVVIDSLTLAAAIAMSLLAFKRFINSLRKPASTGSVELV